VPDDTLEYRLEWADPEAYVSPSAGDSQFDGRLVSRVRIFTRDALAKEEAVAVTVADSGEESAGDEMGSAPTRPPYYRFGYGGPPAPEAKSAVDVASWDDARGVSNVARQTLRRAAGIQIPDREFVLLVLAGYLSVLVPLNYVVFRVLGRIEWAWVAVPLIALGGAATVIKLARLDIGFASSQTELSVVEAQAGFDRAHVTRYSALYTSLSTAYDLAFADPAAVAAPFSTNPAFVPSIGQSSNAVAYRRDKDVRLDDLGVLSNSTGMVRSEHMLDLGGPIRLVRRDSGIWQLENKSRFALVDARVLRRSEHRPALDGIATLGDVAPGATATVAFQPGDSADESTAAAPAASDGERQIDLGPLLAIASDPAQMGPGEVRLVARAAERVPGLETRPSPSQVAHAGLFVVHLRPAIEPAPAPDANAKNDVLEDSAHNRPSPLEALGPAAGRPQGPPGLEGAPLDAAPADGADPLDGTTPLDDPLPFDGVSPPDPATAKLDSPGQP
jgi:hypothetical protein